MTTSLTGPVRSLADIPTQPDRTRMRAETGARLRAAMATDGTVHGPGDGVGEVRRAAQGDLELMSALDVVERTLYDRGKPGPELRLAAAELLDRRATAQAAAPSTC